VRNLEQRITKLETTTIGTSIATVLIRPTEPATSAQREAYAVSLAAAKKAGGPLVLLTLNRTPSPSACVAPNIRRVTLAA
jgi:hypothetical protein